MLCLLDCGQWTVPVYALQIQNGLFHWKDEHEGLSYDIFYCLEKVSFTHKLMHSRQFGRAQKTRKISASVQSMSEIKADFFIRIQLLYPAILLHIR